VGGEEEVGKGYRRVNMVKYCVHMYVNVPMIPAETIPRMRGGGRIREYGGGGKFKYDTFDIL
jgi:hypothetical protein